MPKGDRYAGRTVLLTGAGPGTGAATARRIASEGGTVVVTNADLSAAELIASDVGQLGGRTLVAHLDVTSPVSWREAVARTLEFTGRIDMVHLNAGRNDPAPAAEITDEVWADQLELNLSSALYGVRASLAALRESGSGAVVFTSSIHAIQGIAGYPAYAAAKSGLLGLVRQFAVEYGPAVRFNAVLPGAVETDAWRAFPDALKERLRNSSPLRKAVSPDDVAAAVAFLGSDDASSITGASLVVDAGRTVFGQE